MVRKLFAFLTGLLTLALIFASMWSVSAIYDSADKTTVEAYFFQPNRLSSRRVGVPATPADLGEYKMIQRLVAKYIHEYFYVIPDNIDINRRRSADSVLSLLSSSSVFNDWLAGEATEIQTLADQGAFRVASIVGEIEKPAPNNDYWTVRYELRTWAAPNDMAQEPEIRHGTLYMKLIYYPGLRPEMDVQRYLDMGLDPAGMFKFMVTEIGAII